MCYAASRSDQKSIEQGSEESELDWQSARGLRLDEKHEQMRNAPCGAEAASECSGVRAYSPSAQGSAPKCVMNACFRHGDQSAISDKHPT